MGYGKELKKCLSEKHLRVIELSRLTGISPTTLYSAIQRDSAIRYDNALRIAEVLQIEPSRICSTIPELSSKAAPELQYIMETFEKLRPEDRQKLVRYVRKLEKSKKENP